MYIICMYMMHVLYIICMCVYIICIIIICMCVYIMYVLYIWCVYCTIVSALKTVINFRFDTFGKFLI